MRDLEYRLFSQVRSFSSVAVISAIVLAVGFSQFLGENSIHWQVAIAVIALAAGIPHGALDHLVTLPKSKPTVMALFICIYILVAVIAVIAILEFNVFGFIFVLLMSATHFGIGDAAFINEMDRRGGRKAKLPRAIYAIAAGSIPVLIPLVNSASTDALAQVNPALINWHQGFDQEILGTVSGFAVIAIVTLFLRRRKRESLDLALLLALALIAPPLIAFAVYFGCWHAMRHTARLTLALESSQRNYKEGNLRKVFLSAVIPGTPALVGTFVIAGVLALLGNEFNDDFFWMALVVVWALTVPHMAVTAKLDRSALT
ncbi:MAG: Brp/Blh family beta-carotene 15,15'-dioxygenase [Candidatus Planktophila sp.]|nr:Brp/Blh family beta-carotene 15,15'-dioxygenase [Candidatus Planktophila sp.]